MKITKYVASLGGTSIDFLNERDCDNFIIANVGFQKTIIQEEIPDVILPKVINWTGFKNAMFDNKPLLFKSLPCSAYPLVADMIISAEAGATVYESNFLLAWQLLQSQLAEKGTPFTQSEIDFVNSNLLEFNFTIQI